MSLSCLLFHAVLPILVASASPAKTLDVDKVVLGHMHADARMAQAGSVGNQSHARNPLGRPCHWGLGPGGSPGALGGALTDTCMCILDSGVNHRTFRLRHLPPSTPFREVTVESIYL